MIKSLSTGSQGSTRNENTIRHNENDKSILERVDKTIPEDQETITEQ